ncbi:MAG: Cell division protein FtsL [Chlamydiae bacterium]|nr:Cell division protein FtsL [Chlamydiota bacterium]
MSLGSALLRCPLPGDLILTKWFIMTTLNSINSYSVKKRVLGELLVRSWWVYAFILLNILVFGIALKQANHKYLRLKRTYTELHQSKQRLQRDKKHLSFQINSLEDQKSVELILKKELGLVSDGQTKVYFVNPQ